MQVYAPNLSSEVGSAVQNSLQLYFKKKLNRSANQNTKWVKYSTGAVCPHPENIYLSVTNIHHPAKIDLPSENPNLPFILFSLSVNSAYSLLKLTHARTKV